MEMLAGRFVSEYDATIPYLWNFTNDVLETASPSRLGYTLMRLLRDGYFEDSLHYQ